MPRETAPAFQFYPRDFMADANVQAMTMEERGIYLWLLCHCWLEVCLPLDEARLARMCGASPARFSSRLWPALRGCFMQTPDGYRHKRLDAERLKQHEWRQKSTKGGRRSAEARRKGGSTTVSPPLQPNANTAFASASAVRTDTPNGVSVGTAPVNLLTKPLAYRPRIDVAWPGRPPVPSGLHAELVEKLGGDPEQARLRLLAWYPVAAAPYENQPIGDSDYQFWRARFREWQGTTVKTAGPATPPRVSDAEILADIAAQKALRARR